MHTARQLLRQVRRALRAAMALSAGISALMLAVPLFALHMFETVLPAASIELLVILGGMTAAAVAVAIVLHYARELVLLRAALWLDHVLGQWLLENASTRRVSATELRRQSDAVATLRGAIAEGRLWPVFELPVAAVACCIVALIDPMLGVAMAGLVGVLGILIGAGSRNGSSADAEVAGARQRAAGWLDAVARTGARTSGTARQWALRNGPHVARAYAFGRRLVLVRSLAWGLSIAGIVAVLGLGAYLVIAGRLAPGALVAAAMLMALAMAPLVRLAGGLDRVIAARRAWATLNAMAAAPAVVATSSGRIVFDNAAWTYPGGRTSVLSGITLAIAPGESIGIIGPAGVGKSALAAMIAGAAGDAETGYVPDTPDLLEGSVRDNIAGFDPRLAANAVRAAERAGVDDVIAALTDGYDTQAGEDGRALPMRARRAVAFARALCGNPKVVVLDEPELGLDEAGVNRLLAVFDRLRADGVSLVIATGEPRLLPMTGRVVLLAAGRITAVLPSEQVVGDAPSKQAPNHLRQVA